MGGMKLDHRASMLIPQFTLKELFAAMGLIAAGLSMVTLGRSPMLSGERWWAIVPLGLWYVGGAFLGAGAMTPLKKPWLGAYIGLFAFSLFDLIF